MNARFQFVTLVLWFIATAAGAQALAPEDFTIIEEQPAGELRVYSRSGYTRNEDSNVPGLITTREQTGTMSIVYDADGSTVYMQYPVSDLNALYDAWVRGTLSADGRTITVPMGQNVCYTRSFDMAVQVWVMRSDTVYNAEVGEELATYVVDESVSEVVYTVAADGTIALQGTDEHHILGAVNRAFGTTFSYLDFEWLGYGDYDSVFTPTGEDVNTPPADLATQTLLATTGCHDGVAWEPYKAAVQLGFDGSVAWLKGLTNMLPSAWTKGRRTGDVITFDCGQLLGAWGSTPLYVVRAVADAEGNPVVAATFSFTYDADRKAWVSYDDIMVSTSATDISYVAYYMGMTLAEEADRVADVPEGLPLVDYTMRYFEPDTQGRLVGNTYVSSGAEHDGHVYLRNVTPFVPDGYVVGTIGGDGTVTFPSPQYLGNFFDEESGVDYPIFFQAFDGRSGELLPQVTFTRDATTHVLSEPSSAIGIGINKTGLLCQQYLYDVELTPAAVEQTVHIGYCDDELADALRPVGIAAAGSNRVSAAIHLPRTLLMHYQGMTITRLRFAVRQGFTDMSVWIRTDLGTSSVVVQSADNVVDGWNEVVLNQPLVIDGSDLYIGYSGTQAEGFEGILAYGEGDEYSSWLAVDNEWADYHEYGLGRLYIQAVAEGLLYQRAATIISLQTDRLAYAPDELLAVSGEVENLSDNDLQGYTVSYAIDGQTVATQTANQLLRPDEVATFSHELPLTGLGEGAHELTVSADGNAQSTTFYVYTSTYPRTLLLEHFTSLPCINCPRDDAKLEEVVASRTDVAWVAHHVGYQTDEFTLPIEQSLTRYGIDGNPYVMLDRTAYNEGEPPAFTIGSYDVATIGAIFDYAASMPAFAQLTATATTTDDQLTVTVAGEGKAFLPELYPRAALHVYIVEDQVTAEAAQAGDANKKQHDNIVRQFVTPVRGTMPTWTTVDDTGLPTFTTQLTATLDPSWQRQQLRVVCFLTAQAPTGSGWPTGQVLNTVETRVSGSVGVESVTPATQQPGQWYTLDGRKASKGRLPKGVYLFNGKKIVR
ncbi:MAG: hypothetical protein II949_02955 [Prevotella sp.]|nr:hypothetical protein [Prevotella sp.]